MCIRDRVWIVDLFPLKGIDLALFLCQIPILFRNDSFVLSFINRKLRLDVYKRQGQSAQGTASRRKAGGLLRSLRGRRGRGGLRLLQPPQSLESVIHLLKIRCSKSTGFFYQCNLVTEKDFVLRYDKATIKKEVANLSLIHI